MATDQSLTFMPVRLNTLNSNIPISFNLYIQLPHKYLLYVKDGDNVEESRIKGLKKKKVRKLFISDEDEEKYQSFLDKCLSGTLDDETISTEEKAQVVVNVAGEGAENVFEKPTEEKSNMNLLR